MSPDPARGRRLRRLIATRFGSHEGWTVELLPRLGVSKAALMAWLSGKTEPDLANCGRLAEVLGVRRWQVVRVLDGDEE